MSRRLVVSAVDAERHGVPGVSLGVGPVRAAARMATVLARRRPSAVLLIGSCGVYGDRWPVGAVVRGGRIGFADTGAVAGLGYVPLPPPCLLAGSSPALGGLPAGHILTVAAITSDPQAAALHARDWDLEHMEAYGAALACQDAEVPFFAVLGVANQVGPDAHAQWKAHRVEAEQAACRIAERWLQEDGRDLSLGDGQTR